MTMNTKRYVHSAAAAAVVAASYLMGVIPAEGGFGDVTTVEWLGLVVFMGGAFGIAQSARNATPPERREILDVHDLP